ncbi:MAG: acylphosphatase [Methanothrix sp.]|nr:acylphosphatase [Methanothrix sp.]
MRTENRSKRLTALVSGKFQRVGYRARFIQLANGLGLKGFVENLSDGRVRIIAEGDDGKMKLFEEAIDIKNTFIQVINIEKKHLQPNREFSRFYKPLEQVRRIPAWMKELAY